MKKFVSLMLTLALTASMCTLSYAGGNKNEPAGSKISIRGVDALDGIVGGILGIVQVLGYAFGIGMLLYIGIKYTMASANEKADLKKGSISYVIGAVIILGASTIFSILGTLATQVVTTAS